MIRKTGIAAKPFDGIRIEVDTSTSFGEVLGRQRELMGNTNVPEVVALAKEATTEAEYVQGVEERFVGASGFMLFYEIDHGGRLSRSGINRHVVRWAEGGVAAADTAMFDIAMPLFETDDVRRGIPSAVKAAKEGRPRPVLDFKGH
jgi:hypothetical protein